MRQLWVASSAFVVGVVGAALTLLAMLGAPTVDERGVIAAAVVSGLVGLASGMATRQLVSSWWPPESKVPKDVTERLSDPSTRTLPLDEVIQQVVDSLRSIEPRRRVEVWQARAGRLSLTHSLPPTDAPPIDVGPQSASTAAVSGVVGQGWLRTWLPSLSDVGSAIAVRPGAGGAPDADGSPPDLVRAAPMAARGELLGMVVLRRAAHDPPFSAAEAERLAQVQRPLAGILNESRLAGQLRASVDELQARNTELQRSRQRLVAVADAERRRLERDLHDGAQARLTALGVRVQVARTLATRSPERVGELLDEVAGELAEAVGELRSLAHGIMPPLLLSGGLRDALPEAADRSRVPTTVEPISPERFGHEVEAAVYFCCVEALQNVAKHAGTGARAHVAVHRVGEELHFEVDDDGSGFTTSRRAGAPTDGGDGEPRPDGGRRGVDVPGRGQGLTNIVDRVGALGGTVAFGTSDRGGAVVSGVIPLPARALGP